MFDASVPDLLVVNKAHIVKSTKLGIEIKVLDKMRQDPQEKTIFEAIEELTECPPQREIDLEKE